MRIWERLFPKTEVTDQNKANLVPNLRAVIFEDSPLVKRYLAEYIQVDLGGQIIGIVGTRLDAFEIVDEIRKGNLSPNVAIVDQNLIGSIAGPNKDKGEILDESGADDSELGTGHFVTYALRRIRTSNGLNLRIIGHSANNIMNISDERFKPDVAIMKGVPGMREAFLRELRFAASKDQ